MDLPPALPATPQKRHWALPLLSGLVLVMALGVIAFRFSQLQWYFAQVTLQLARPTGFWYNPPNPMQELQIIRKTEILYPVIDMLGLTQGYVREEPIATRQEAFNKLVESLRIELVSSDPPVVRVGVYDRDPQRAANIANTIALVYRNQRMKDAQTALERSLSQYGDEVEKQRAAVTMAAQEMQRIGAQDQVTDPDPEHADAPLTGQATGAYLTAKTHYLQARRILENAEVALGKARQEKALEEPPVRILEKAVPPMKPVPWWRGDPRTLTGI